MIDKNPTKAGIFLIKSPATRKNFLQTQSFFDKTKIFIGNFLRMFMTFCLINALRSLGSVAVDFGANVFVERSARTIRNKKKMNLCNNSPSIKMRRAYLEKIGSFGTMNGFEMKLTYSWWMFRKIVLISFSRNAEFSESTTRMNFIFVFVM